MASLGWKRLTHEVPYRPVSNFCGKRNKNITHINPFVPELNGCGNLRETRIWMATISLHALVKIWGF
jgi:hypothetical protein